MAKIEIRYFTGDVERREINKTQPVSIGRQASNDICVDEDDVGTLHCRIAWNKTGYEVVAAQPAGVEVNGIAVQHAPLADGDVIRVGTIDIALMLDGEKVARAAVPASKPLPDDLFDDGPDEAMPVAAVVPPVSRKETGSRRGAAQLPTAEPVSDDDVPTARPVAESDGGEEPFVERDDRDEAKRKAETDSLAARLRKRLHAGAARPGEEEIVRSKLNIILTIGIPILALVCGVLWFWTKLNAAEKDFKRAEALHKEQKYKQAIEVYTEFLNKYSRNKYTDDVFFGRARARVEQHITGAAPNWQLGLDAAKEFRKENRNREAYAEQAATLNGYAVKIALGACKTAEQTRQRKFLPIAEDARSFVRQLTATDEFETDFKKAYRRAEDAVVRYEHFKAAEAGIKAALEKPDISTALQQRLDFLQFIQKYDPPTLLRDEDRVFSRQLKQTMDTERSLIKSADLNRKAETKDRPERSLPARSLTLHSRPTDGLTSDRSQLVIGLAKGCCYGVDKDTGEPLWRRVVGPGESFFPLSVNVRVKSLLLFDTHFGELQLVEQFTGKLVWRQPLRDARDAAEQVAGPPLVHDGQIYLPTLQNNLYQIDLNSGQIKTRLTFSQPVLAPPVVAPDGARLVLAGDKALVYTIQMDPKKIACTGVDYVGHRSGSVRAPLMRIGKLVLMCENDRSDSCRLRVLNTSANGTWLKELTFSEPGKQIRVQGKVFFEQPRPAVKDRPVIRQNKLFVSSSGERVTVFTVSDDTARPEAERNRYQFLRPVAHFEDKKSEHSGPIYLVAGPNDQVWMASNRLSKFQLKTKVLVREDEETAPGRATQPLQEIGQNIYVGRQTDYSSAVYLTQHDREAMDKGRWRVILGSSIIAWHASPKANLVVCMNEEGDVFRITPQELAAGGFSTEAAIRNRLPKGLREPVKAITLPDGRFVAVANGTEESVVWILDAVQREDRTVRSPRRVEAEPLPLGDGLILPLAGRLRYVNVKPGGGFGYEDYEAPFVKGKGDPPRWMHLAALSKTEFVALDSKGRLRRIQLRAAGGRRYLGMAVERLLPNPPGYGFAAHGGRIILADNAGNLEILNPATLQPAATVKAGGNVSNTPWVVGDRLYVEIAFRKLVCYRIGESLQKAWELPLAGESGLVAAPVMIGQSLVVAERDGTVQFVNPADGKATATHRLAQPIDHPPTAFGGTLLVPTFDGSLYSVKAGG
jgi:outer membrane protein assembly factor BamB/pSer/pThr/pTyr-binding forkhead associated (FHA) protein